MNVYEVKFKVDGEILSAGFKSDADEAMRVCLYALQEIYPDVRFVQYQNYVQMDGDEGMAGEWFGRVDTIPVDNFNVTANAINFGRGYGPDTELIARAHKSIATWAKIREERAKSDTASDTDYVKGE